MADDPKISVFRLGAGGVQLVKSPLEMADTELVSAQNAEPYATRGRFGLRKRLGLTRVVPTGTVTPGSAGGAILGGFVLDDSLGYPPLAGGDQTLYGNGYYSLDGGVTWVAYTPTETFIPLNSVYNLATGYDGLLSPQLPPVWFDGFYIAGGQQSGQVVTLYLSSAALGGSPPHQLLTREATRVSATGSLNDTYVLPGIFNAAGGIPQVVVAIAGGQMYLYSPDFGTVTQLPTLGATATGSATFYNRLYVTAGLSLYSIEPSTESAWTTVGTVADAGIAGLTGLAVFNSALYMGSSTNAIDPVRVYVCTPPALGGTASIATSASVIMSGAPAYMFGPYPPLPGDTRINVLYFGVTPAFTTLTGSLLNAETMAGTSWRVITFDGALWHNGVDTASNDLVTTEMAGSSNREPGPIVNVAGRTQVQLSRYIAGSGHVAGIRRIPAHAGASWGSDTIGGSVVPDSYFALPAGMTF